MPTAIQTVDNFKGDRLSVRMFEARGNGVTSDTAAFQAAINKCADDNLALYIPHGIYLLDEPLVISAPVTIFGAGHQSQITIIDKFNDESMRALFRIDSDDVTIDSLLFDGNRVGQEQRAVMIGFGADVQRVRISRISCKNTWGYGIQCSGFAPTDLEIVDCSFKDHEGPGYAISVDSGSTRLRINRNTVVGVTETEGGNGGGILVFHPSTYSCFDVLLEGNTVIDCAGVPLELQRGERAQVLNNRVRGGGANGISVGAANHLLVKGNISKDQTSYGFEGGAGDHQIWQGNQAISCGIGMIFDNSGGTLRRDIQVIDNIIDTTIGTDGGSGSGHGLRFFDCTQVICRRNTIIDPLDTGIVFIGTGTNRVTGEIDDNIIHFKSARPSQAPVGIQLGNKSFYTKVRGNRIQVDAAADNSDLFYLGPIILTGTVSYPEITDNIINRDTETGRSPHRAITVQSGGSILQGRISRNVVKRFAIGIKTDETSGTCDISDNDVKTCLTGYEIHANHYTSGLHLFTGDVGIGIEPTARLHLAAGTATAGDAPLKLTSGPLLSTPEAGAKEYDGNFEYFTAGSTRYTNERMLQTSFTPTGAGWYRIMSGVNYIGGVLRVEGFVDNYRSDIECVFGQMAYGNRGSIHLHKIANYPGLDDDLISQIRISNNDSLGQAYLDIYVRSATIPALIRVYVIGPNANGIVAAPTSGASAGPDSVTVIGTSRYPSISEPLLLTPRSLIGAPLSSLLEFDGDQIYITDSGGTRHPMGLPTTTANRVVQTDATNELITDKIDLGDSNFVKLTAGDNSFMKWNAGAAEGQSLSEVGGIILDEIKVAMLAYIQAEILINTAQVTGLDTALTGLATDLSTAVDALETSIDSKAAIDHGHSISTALVGTPEEHSHTI